MPKNAKPSTDTTSVGIQKNKTLKMVLLRLAVKNSPNNNTPIIQNLGEKRLSTKLAAKAANPVALDPLNDGQENVNSAMNRAANPLRMSLT
jgi:hypothetical protein